MNDILIIFAEHYFLKCLIYSGIVHKIKTNFIKNLALNMQIHPSIQKCQDVLQNYLN